jgi:hypothetical protein
VADVAAAWEKIRTQLENEYHRIYQEIKSYPRPIPACDVEFNYLLEERARISQEIERLREASKESLPCSEPVERLEAFVRASRYLDRETKESIL